MRIIVAMLTLLLTASLVVAQQPQPAAPPSCEAQLEEARTININLRKLKAQADFAVANLEEALTAAQKKTADLEAKDKAKAKEVEKK
jgi:hypothetical protein